MLLSLLLAPAAALPPLSEVRQRDVGCAVAVGIIANEQRRGIAPSFRFPNVMQRGRQYMDMVGGRLMQQYGISRETATAIMKQSFEDQARAAAEADDPKAYVDSRMATCLPLLDREVPAVPPVAADYLFCAAVIELAAEEAEMRGSDEMSVKVIRQAGRIAADKYRAASPDKSEIATLSDIAREKADMIDRDARGEPIDGMSEAESQEKFQGCMFLASGKGEQDAEPAE